MSDAELRGDLLEGHQPLFELRERWQALWHECPSATPFQHPDWLLAWARQHRSQHPWTVVVYERERLVGLAPLFRYRRAGARVLAFLGAGVSDYCDVLAAPGRERAVLGELLSVLAQHCDRWDVCELDEVPASGSPLAAAIEVPGWSLQSEAQSVCPVVLLPSSIEAMTSQRLPLDHLRRYQKYWRRAHRAGRVRLQRATRHTCERLLDIFFALHEACWRARGEPGCMSDAAVRAHHHQAAAAFAERNALGLHLLWIDERPIAAVYGFERDQTFYSYLGGFDPQLARLSPGILVLGLVFEQLIARGFTRFDFLRGGEAYKYWWGAEDRHTVRLRLTYSG